MIVLTIIKAIGDYLLNFYIFKGTKKIKEHVSKCEERAM